MNSIEVKKAERTGTEQTKIQLQIELLVEISTALQLIEKYVRLFYILAMIGIILLLLSCGLFFLQSCH